MVMTERVIATQHVEAAAMAAQIGWATYRCGAA
jgi:hypothetical protein